jgi:nucleoside-diphosphate-sugar epimerase
MLKISILGCGWLGLPLAQTLIEKGYFVNGSTTSPEKIPVLEKSGINPFLIAANTDEIDGDIASFLEGSDMLIIDFPPKLRGNASESFVSKIKTLIPYIEISKIPDVVFISSISVYGDDHKLTTETAVPNPVTESGKQLLEAEQLLTQNKHFAADILRFGGLVGNDRHPVYHIAGKTNLEHAQAPINLIHLSDCIGIILAILKKRPGNEIFNAVAPFHPSRKQYYEAKATSMKLEKPVFMDGEKKEGKTISSEKLKRVLGYEFLITENI